MWVTVGLGKVGHKTFSWKIRQKNDIQINIFCLTILLEAKAVEPELLIASLVAQPQD